MKFLRSKRGEGEERLGGDGTLKSYGAHPINWCYMSLSLECRSCTFVAYRVSAKWGIVLGGKM